MNFVSASCIRLLSISLGLVLGLLSSDCLAQGFNQDPFKTRGKKVKTVGLAVSNTDSLEKILANEGVESNNGYKTFKEYWYVRSYTKRRFERDIIDSILRVVKKKGDPEGLALAYNIAAGSYISFYQRDSALLYLDSFFAINNTPRWPYLHGRSLLFNGVIVGDRGEIDSAFVLLEKAIDQFRKAKDYYYLGHVFNQFGIFYGQKGLRSETIKFYKAAKANYHKAGFQPGELRVTNNIADLYLRAEMPDSAILILEEVWKGHSYKDKNSPTYYLSRLTYAEALQQKGRIKEALAVGVDAMNILQDDNYHSGFADAFWLVGQLYVANKNYLEGIKYLYKALDLAQKEKLTGKIAQYQGALSSAYKAIGRLDSALYYLERSNEVTDGIRTEAAIRLNEEFNTKLQAKEKEQALQLAQQQNEHFAHDIENNKKVQLLGLALLLALAIGLCISIILFYRLRKRKNQLQLQKEVIESVLQELEKSNKALEKANHTKDKLFTIVAHDLRGPIGGLNNLPLLLRQATDAEGKLLMPVEQLASAIEKSVGPVYNLMEDLLVWAQANQQELQLNIQSNSINNLLVQLMEIYVPLANKKEIALNIQLPSEDLRASVDENSFFTILRNLVGNAIKFTPIGGKVTVNVKAVGNNNLQIAIEDSGSGMDQGQIENILLQLRRVTTEGTAGEKGTGMGLMLVMELAKLNGIQIEIKSQKNLGTTILLTLPMGNG